MLLKQQLIIAVRESGTSDTPVALPILDDSIDINTKEVTANFPRNTLDTPLFTNINVNSGIQETTIKFTTYIKPYKDTDVELVDKLLHESLLGNFSTNTTQLCTSTEPNTNILKKFDLYIIYPNQTFSLLDAVSLSADYIFDLNGISRIKWNIVGSTFTKEDTPITYNTISDGTYIRNRLLTPTIHFPQSQYTVATTKFNINVKNTINFPYTEILNTQFNKVTIPVITKREITGNISVYLKAFTLALYTELLDALEQYTYLDDAVSITANANACGVDYINIDLHNVTIKYPKIKNDDVVSLDMSFNADETTICYKE